VHVSGKSLACFWEVWLRNSLLFFHGKYTVKGQNGVEKLEFWFFESLAQVWKWFNLPSIISTVTWGDLS